MELRQLTPDLAVSPQIAVEDIPTLAEAGFKVLIVNRPDEEVGPDLHHDTIGSEAEKAGMRVYYIPFTPGEITPDMVTSYAAALGEPGPALAYCRSGNRSTVLWALTEAGNRPVDEIVETAAQAGYDINGVRPLLQSRAAR